MHRLDEDRQAEIGHHGVPVGAGVEDREARRGQAGGQPHQLGAPLVHGDGRGHHAAAGVGNAHQLEGALHGAVLAAAAVQRDEGAVEALFLEDVQIGSAGSKAWASTPAACRAASTAPPRHQGDLALGGVPPSSTATFPN
jgi:hypothetical protein